MRESSWWEGDSIMSRGVCEVWTYEGMSEAELLAVCIQKNADKGVAAKQFGISEMYSQGKIFREYSGFPSWLPLNICADHGAGGAEVLRSELENDAYAMFSFGSEKCIAYRTVSEKPCFRVMHPFVWYRRNNGIAQAADARGTIAFPAHSLADVQCDYQIEQYIKALKALPAHMQPVCVCLFTIDVLQGAYKAFIEQGIPVYTAGNISDVRFVDRYYNIIRHFKYATSNAPGSCLFYSVEMGLPFSIYGGDVTYVNYGNGDVPLGKLNEFEYEKRCNAYFSGINTEITVQQRDYVLNYFFGGETPISPREMRKILFAAWFMRDKKLQDVIKGLRRLFKRIFLRNR